MCSFVLSLTKSLTKNATERLLGCRGRVWHYRRFTLPSEPPDISPEYSGPESTKIFNVLLDVSVILDLSWSLPYFRT